jgi:hypothetical protein
VPRIDTEIHGDFQRLVELGRGRALDELDSLLDREVGLAFEGGAGRPGAFTDPGHDLPLHLDAD